MAPRGARAATKPAAPVEPEEAEEADYTAYATKDITPTAEAYAEWLTDETGYEVDARSIYLAMSLRRKFQHDEATRIRVAEIREERKPAKPAAEEKPAAAAKPARGAAKGVTSTSSTSRPKPGRAAAAAAPAPARGRGRAKATAAAAPADAPF